MDALDMLEEIEHQLKESNQPNQPKESKQPNQPKESKQLKETNQSQQLKSVNYTPIGTNVIYVTKSGAFIKFSDVTDMSIIKKIENYFTLKTITVTGAVCQSKRCLVDKAKQRIIVPRFGVYEILNDKFKLLNFTTKSQISPGLAPSSPFNWKLNFYNENQRIVSEYILANIYTEERVNLGSAGLILDLEAGQGKSYVAMYLMSKIQRKTAIILHTTSLIEQWVKVINACFDGVDIGMYYAGAKRDGDIVIFIVDSALKQQFKFGKGTIQALDYYNQFGFVIYDECHIYANNFCGRVFKQAQTPYMLGLSATPCENTNKFDPLVWWEVGPVLNAKNIPGYVHSNVDFKAEIYKISYYGPPSFTRIITNEKLDMVNVAATVNMICSDPYRNQLIVECVKKCLAAGHFTFVFADRREYLETLRKMLVDVETSILATEDDYIRLVGGSSQETLIRAEKGSKVILATYQYLATGKSIPRMTALVMATPRRSKIKQYIGRIFRLGSDASIVRLIYDIVDMRIPLKGQYSTRKKTYTERKYKIIESKHDFTEYATGVTIVKPEPPITKPTEKPQHIKFNIKAAMQNS